jgi:hypothetical protein
MIVVKKTKIVYIRNLLDFSRSRDQRLPGSLLPKRKDPGYEVEKKFESF